MIAPTVAPQMQALVHPTVFDAIETRLPSSAGQFAKLALVPLFLAGSVTAGGILDIPSQPATQQEWSLLTASAFAPIRQAATTPPTTHAEDLASALRRLHAQSGLAWGQIADALGVSRRTVHNWVTGARMTGRNADRLGRLVEMVDQYGAMEPASIRSALLAPGPDGQNAISRFKSTRSIARLPRRIGSFADAVAGSPDEVGEPVRALVSSRPVPVRQLGRP